MTSKRKPVRPLKIAGEPVQAGERKRIQIEVASLFDYTRLSIPVEVVRGAEAGPILFISAAIHGDEINGFEVVKRILKSKSLARIRGTLIAVPIVNVFGFNNRSRYLPDRRDLNRSFPGKKTGPLASKLANLFMKEIVSKCTHGIDLHTGAIHRTNLPQIRACLDDKEALRMAKMFNVPVIMHSELRDGSLREACRRKKVPALLFEGGEALRFDEEVIKGALKGCFSVMRGLGMLPEKAGTTKPKTESFVARGSSWVRAPHSGSFRLKKKLGDRVLADEVMATITDAFGDQPHDVKATSAGIIIGMSTIPLVNRGDAIFHVATFENSKKVKREIDYFEDML